MKKLLFLLIVLLPSCQQYQYCSLEIKIRTIDMHLFIDESDIGSKAAPPQLYFKFSAIELNDKVEPYILSERRPDPKAFIVDTLRKQVIPIVLGPTVIEVSSSDTSYFMGYVNFYDHGEYFGLDRDYFHRLDFLNDKDLLRKKSIDMLNHSILMYIDEASSSLEDLIPNQDGNNCKKSVIIDKPTYNINDIEVY